MIPDDRSKAPSAGAEDGPVTDPLLRRAYQPPTLRVYGDLSTITKAVGFSSTNADGGAVIGMRKTF